MLFKGKSFVLKVAKQHSLTQARLFYNSFSTKLKSSNYGSVLKTCGIFANL